MNRIDPVALTQALVRANTVNPPGHEDLCTTQLADLLSDAGFTCRMVEFAPRRSSLVARIGGSPGRLPLCFTGHVDVVPLGAAAWQHDPFGAEIVDGRLYGRGSSDMKSGVAAFVVAAIDLADLLRQGPGLTLIITAGEETGCEGATHMVGLAEAQAFIGTAGALVVGEPTGNQPLFGHKGAFWLSASARGTTAHGSMPERGNNAVYKIARAALALENFSFEAGPHARGPDPVAHAAGRAERLHRSCRSMDAACLRPVPGAQRTSAVGANCVLLHRRGPAARPAGHATDRHPGPR